MSGGLGQRLVEICNQIGNQTSVTVTNYSEVRLLVTLEVAGVVFHSGLVEPRGDGTSATSQVSFTCGYAVYTIGAVEVAEGSVLEDFHALGPKQSLHFVTGGSKVSVMTDSSTPSLFKLVNDSAEWSNEASEKLEKGIQQSAEIYNDKVRPHVDKAKAIIDTKITPKVDAAIDSARDWVSEKTKSSNANPEQQPAATVAPQAKTGEVSQPSSATGPQAMNGYEPFL
mmetsp:Transcript_20863/g.38811  ORF Transcript_20863/g.38811 Transcript_20863/m.38811 type:complete len:226 (-) Transcript_20863:120-797(-)